MGCDIHAYVEYVSKEEYDAHKAKLAAAAESEEINAELKSEHYRYPYWRNLGNRINPGRNYWLFAHFSRGVRSYNNTYAKYSIPAKGLPDPTIEGYLGFSSNADAYIIINNALAEKGYEEFVSLETAKRWEKSGNKILMCDGSDVPWKVEYPDWHSHTWLTTAEYKHVLDHFTVTSASEGVGYDVPEYFALLAAMECLEARGFYARIVMWFDN